MKTAKPISKVLQLAVLQVFALSSVACGSDNDDKTADNDTDTTFDTASDETIEGMDTDEAVGQTEATQAAFTPTMAIAGPLVDVVVNAEDSQGAQDDELQGVMEDAVSGNSIVTDAACVSYVWNRLSGTITMTNCVLEATGTAINGTATIALSLLPATVDFSFTELTVGNRAISGKITISRGGTIKEPAIQMAATIALEQKDGENISLEITSSTLAVDLNGVEVKGYALDGLGMLTSPMVTAPFMATGVYLKMGDCHPSSGDVAFETSDSTIVTFLNKTPATGIVNVTKTITVRKQKQTVTQEISALDPCPK